MPLFFPFPPLLPPTMALPSIPQLLGELKNLRYATTVGSTTINTPSPHDHGTPHSAGSLLGSPPPRVVLQNFWGRASAGSSSVSVSPPSSVDSAGTNTGNTKLILNYLPRSLTEAMILQLFSTIGEVAECSLVKDRVTGESSCYAFVKYVHPEHAAKAVATLNGIRLHDKTMKVSFARPRSDEYKGSKVYFSGLGQHFTDAELEQLFEPFGQILWRRVFTDKVTGLRKDSGFVMFNKRSEAEAAIAALDGTIPPGFAQPLVVRVAQQSIKDPISFGLSSAELRGSALPPSSVAEANEPLIPLVFSPLLFLGPPEARPLPGPVFRFPSPGHFRYSPFASGDFFANSLLSRFLKTGARPMPASPPSIFVHNLAPDATDLTLWKMFGPFGAVLSVHVVQDTLDKHCKGYGFASMANYAQALFAIATLNGSSLDGRVLRVEFTQPPKRKAAQDGVSNTQH